MVKQLNKEQVQKARLLSPEQKKELEDMFPHMVGTIDLDEWNRQKAARHAARAVMEDDNESKAKQDE